MSGPSKAIVLDPDQRSGLQLQLGFEREGVPALAPPVPVDGAALVLDPEAAVVVVGGANGQALDLVRRARAARPELPILFAGKQVSRGDAEAAGADEILARPAYLRDLVTVARLMRGLPVGQRDHLVGSLAETTTVFALVRAFAALGRSAVLTLIRGLRRGEVRFYKGEVTSAQVGLIHGQAAFHQLLLWTDARFDFHHEELVRRQQIPLPPDELFADAERFLEGVRESSGALSPSTILEQDIQRIHGLGKQIPTEVHGVLRMFDGHRMLADILEDSPYRVFETLRVAQRAVDAGLLRPIESQRPKATWRAVLAIEEWLVGSETREAVVERTVGLDATGPVAKQSGGNKKKRKRRARTPAPGVDLKAQPITGKPAASKDIDWGALVPRVIGAEVGPLSGVVPALAAHGEVEMMPTREKPREGLEALMDTDKRDRIFPTEIGLEPSVVVRGEDEPDEWERAEWSAKNRARSEPDGAEAQTTVHEKVALDAGGNAVDAQPAAETGAAAETTPAAEPTATAETDAAAETRADEARDASQARVGESVERMRIERLRREEAEARAREEAARSAAADDAKHYAARVKAAAEARRIEAERKERDEGDRAAAKLIAMPSIPAPRAIDAGAAVTATSDVASPPRERAKPGTDARDLVKQLVAEALPPPAAGAVVEATPQDSSVRARLATPITVAETPAAIVSVTDTVTVVAAADTAHLTASPTVLVREAPPPAEPPAGNGAPVATEDEPSDGVVKAMIATIDTAKLARQRQSRPTPEHDGPAQTEATGEIASPERHPAAAPGVQPPAQASIVIDQPSMLVSDLAAVHAAAAAAIATPITDPPPGDAASPSRELAVSEVRRDAALALDDVEEAFFTKAETGPVRVARVETFDDLDEGYEPPKFWDRVFGRKKPPPR